jgi:hypothetical protein
MKTTRLYHWVMAASVAALLPVTAQAAGHSGGGFGGHGFSHHFGSFHGFGDHHHFFHDDFFRDHRRFFVGFDFVGFGFPYWWYPDYYYYGYYGSPDDRPMILRLTITAIGPVWPPGSKPS